MTNSQNFLNQQEMQFFIQTSSRCLSEHPESLKTKNIHDIDNFFQNPLMVAIYFLNKPFLIHSILSNAIF